MQWHQSVRYGCSTPLIVEPGCYLCSGSWCEFVSLSVSVWLFQMLKWIISQKLLNVQWKVVTETPVSDFQLFFFFFPPPALKSGCAVLIQQVSILAAKMNIFAEQIRKWSKKTWQVFRNTFQQTFRLSNEIFISESGSSHLCLSYVSKLLGLSASLIL